MQKKPTEIRVTLASNIRKGFDYSAESVLKIWRQKAKVTQK